MINGSNNLVQFENFTLDTEKRVLLYKEEHVELPLKAIELLCVLVESDGELVSKEQILDTVWKDSFVEESVLTQNIYRVRKVFKEHGIEDELIKNVPRRGYRFLGEITEIVEEEVSIERTVVEKNLIAEMEFDDDLLKDKFPEIQPKQIPASTSQPFFKNNNLIFASLIVLLSFFAIGAGYWYWKSPNSGNLRSGLITGNLKIENLTASGKAWAPAISRDNQHLAYTRSDQNTFSLILKHLPTQSETVVIEPKDYEVRSVNFSADGNYIFYITREKEKRESTIYKIPIYGGAKQQIITNVRHHFSISPDGEQLAFFRYDAEKDITHLMTCKIDGSDERIIATRKPPALFSVWETFPAWSPDGKRLVVTGYDRHKEKQNSEQIKLYLVEIDVETGKEKLIKHPDWKAVHQAFWLRDGSGLIASVREDTGSYSQFWHISYPDGGATRITNDTNNYFEFRLSYDTKSIITANKHQYANLMLVSLEDTKNVTQLTSKTVGNYGLWGLDWTNDGKHLVYTKSLGREDGNLWKIDVETKETQQLTFGEEKDTNSQPKVMPDGKSVVFSSNRLGTGHIWQVDLDGQNLKQITNTKGGERYPEISEDGMLLFYGVRDSGDNAIWKMPLAGGVAEKVLDNAGGVSKVSPTNSEKVIAHYFDPKEKEKSPWKYAIFSHESKNILDLLELEIVPHNHSIEWSKDGTGIFFPARTATHNNLWFYSLNNNKARQVTNFDNQRIVNLSLSPDGKTIALASGAATTNILQIRGY